MLVQLKFQKGTWCPVLITLDGKDRAVLSTDSFESCFSLAERQHKTANTWPEIEGQRANLAT